ncbi:hypothetical protein F3Y22_tig00117056pilonHSYRG01111 [Hibiscus syriacus]|uniref:HTH myb-type domain-containing protein n=1 Tax=Hibiscus syriacus TaxID=106335 RepID=A0A6A2XK60_HIBSY|nr:hypothetical protein F3Y22_tig00117056pilonHSYRG01111 [Hibiscus syriacus]
MLKKLVDKERAHARAVVESERAAVQRVEEALQEREQMYRDSGKQVMDIEDVLRLPVVMKLTLTKVHGPRKKTIVSSLTSDPTVKVVGVPIPKAVGLLRCGKSCRLRWINYLRPDFKRGNFTEGDELVIKLHSLLGNKWSLIAGRLPERIEEEEEHSCV